MSRWIDAEYCENALSRQVMLQLFDDNDDGDLDENVVANLIERAEAHVYSFVIAEYGAETIKENDVLLKAAALEFFHAFACDRHPEHMREDGDRHFNRGVALMKRIQKAEQRPPETNAAARPVNVGSYAAPSLPKIIGDSSDGTVNGGDF